MTNDDAIYTLDRLRHIEAKWPGTEDTLKAIEMAIRAIRAVSSNEPLTLDQLRCMDGKPAYWPEAGIWGVISVESNEKWGKIPFFCGKWNGENLKHDIELRGMEVYAYPPTHIDREAWTAEWTVDEFGHKCSKCGEYLPDGEDVRKPQFCPECGRAMTDEAVQMVMERLEALYENP